ncbi:MAG: hypothetical protein OET90_05530 [Desulfuromonadales bacterium]|nr:hypothetical protein [Desulfuromonadales bacterium]
MNVFFKKSAVRVGLLTLAFAALSITPALAELELVSIPKSGAVKARGGGNGNGFSFSSTSDGLYTAFISNGSDLDPTAYDIAFTDIFVRNNETGDIQKISKGGPNGQATNNSTQVDIAAYGHHVAYTSYATDIYADRDGDGVVDADQNGSLTDIFLYNIDTDTTKYVSVQDNGSQNNRDSTMPSVSGNGQYVAFQSLKMHSSDPDITWEDILVRDTVNGTTKFLSRVPGSGHCRLPDISTNGQFVTFSCVARNSVNDDDYVNVTNINDNFEHIYVYDLVNDTLELVSISGSGAVSDNNSSYPVISDSGRYVAFNSDATNLDLADDTGVTGIYIRDRALGTTTKVVAAGFIPSMSDDGRYVTALGGAADHRIYNTQTGEGVDILSDCNDCQSTIDASYFINAEITADGNKVLLNTLYSWDSNIDDNSAYDLYYYEICGEMECLVPVCE